jgi:hypothetical protein
MLEQTPDVRMYMYLTPDVYASLLLKLGGIRCDPKESSKS